MKKMDNSAKKLAPPLWIWLIFSLVALISVTILFRLLAIKNENDFAKKTYYLQNKIKTAGRENPIVIILGSSLTRCAYDSSSIMENFIEGRTGKKPVIAKIWRSATNLETIIDHMPVLKDTHPDILVVEANMFCYSAEHSLINEIPSLLYNVMDQEISKFYLPEAKPQKRQDTGQIKTRRGIIDTSQLQSFKQLALILKKQGTRIVLVNIPVEASEEAKKWNSADTINFKQNFDYIQQQVPFTYFDPKQFWDMSYYYNRGHLNMKGCKAFTQWFCNKLSHQVNQL